MRVTYERMVSLVLFGVWFFVVICTVFITIYGSGYRLNTIPIKSAIESQLGMGTEFRGFVAEKYEALKSQFFITPSDKQAPTESQTASEHNSEFGQNVMKNTHSVKEESVASAPMNNAVKQEEVTQQTISEPAASVPETQQAPSTVTDKVAEQAGKAPVKQGAYVTNVSYKASNKADTIQFQLSYQKVRWTGFFVNKKKAWVLDIQGNWGIDTKNIWRFEKGPVEKVVLIQYDGFVRSVLWLRESDMSRAPHVSHSGNTLSVNFSR
ncbi:AMIN domain-containing protein [uncultured Shewanella sp.]|uniref:AMIN domain-containing protein n=1 Tax=uncultured Shewanella sp. TaxID=173975 RepID=UPI0026176D67|nr:AMIN domain-containing protein [uncultured Shewanella sp.]